jgi:L-lactate dehydrogenase (cytochrome)
MVAGAVVGEAGDKGRDAARGLCKRCRQLDTSATPIDYLPAIRDRIQDDAQLIADGGIRRGTDVLKAIALGADGCSIGRPYLYGLAAGGEAGVARVLEIFRSEIERDMRLMGRTRIADITADDVDHISQFRSKPGSARASAKPKRISP